MDWRHKTVAVFFLLCSLTDIRAMGQTPDVCSSCHANATCDDKSDGSGKVCNCMYGFVGNGRTFCQDKDECQIGANKICGHHTSCHNTYGSYYCTCLSGYSPSNSMSSFIPNDGTHCQDIDECQVSGLCGEGGRCMNLDGSFECHCEVGYQVHNGAQPFHPQRDKASCKVIDCGQPPSAEDMMLMSATGTRYGSVAVFDCDDGLLWRSGNNTSVCGADGAWKGPTMVCEVIDCGSPPAYPHSHVLWNQSPWMGSEVVYLCDSGYVNVGQDSVSVCSPRGQWEEASVLCQEILCGSPPVIKFTEQVWDGDSTPGRTVLYSCKEGFLNKGGDNMSLCTENGHWTQPALSCQEILCGVPPILPHTGHEWNGSSSPGTTVFYYCKDGFYDKEANNIALCTVNGYWTKTNISCKEVDCGVPPPQPHSVMLWDGGSTMGSQVVYQCISGYINVGGGNKSACTDIGQWDEAFVLCQEIECGEPAFKPHTKVFWDNMSHVGSVVYYQCTEGYHTMGVKNFSVCGENGLWEDVDLWCEEISCGPPITYPHTKIHWDQTSRPSSKVVYVCMYGYYQESGHGISTCSITGEWGKVSIKCKAKCGPIPFLANSEVVWHDRSVVIHRCVDGYHSWRGSNVSICDNTGVWQKATLTCIAKCGPVPFLANSEVVWQNRSVVIHRCVDGYHSWRGSNISICDTGIWQKATLTCMAKCGPIPFLANSEVVWQNKSVVIHCCVDGYHSWRGSNISICDNTGVWQKATLTCIEIKPAITDLVVFNEKCLWWKAEKYEDDTEVYKVIYMGSRAYQRLFHDKRKRFLNSKADRLQLCLNLLPATNYSISITAVSAKFTVTVTTNTSLKAPQAPVIYYREVETPLPTLRLLRPTDTLDQISLYQVFVLPVEAVMVFDCTSPGNSDFSSKQKSLEQYVTAQIQVRRVGREMNFTVGDGLYYGGFYNAPLQNGRDYYIILRAVSQWNGDFKSACVLWAKAKGTSYVIRISSLSAGGSIGLVTLVILGGYSYSWFSKM